MNENQVKALLVSLFAGLLLFIPFLGGVHLFDWDEINFAESAREMIASGNYLTIQINYIPFWENPPPRCAVPAKDASIHRARIASGCRTGR